MSPLLVTAEAGWLSGSALTSPVAVLVEEGFVVWAGRPAQVPAGEPLEVPGVLLPGLVDHHVHTGLVDTTALSRGGLTTVRDLGWVPSEIWPRAHASWNASVDGPRILAAGPFLTAPGGYPTDRDWAPEGIAWELDGPEAAVAAVRSLAVHRPVTVKVALNSEAGPVLDDATLSAVARTAHGLGLTVTAHTEGSGQTARALEAGVDQLAHAPWSERLADDLLDELARRVGIVSTVDIHGQDTPQRGVALDNLRRFHTRGGTVLYGTDLGNGPLPEGVNAAEITALHQAGMGAEDILRSLGGAGVRPGSRADLVTVAADPFEDPTRLARATTVLKAGVPVRDDHEMTNREERP